MESNPGQANSDSAEGTKTDDDDDDDDWWLNCQCDKRLWRQVQASKNGDLSGIS